MTRSVWDIAKREDITDSQGAFIEWLCDPERRGNQTTWARDNGINPQTAAKWKKEPRFITAWEARLRALNIDPNRVQAVVDAMYQKALDGDTRAMQLYLQYIEKFTPTTRRVIEDRSVKDMSDADLAVALEQEVHHLKVVGED